MSDLFEIFDDRFKDLLLPDAKLEKLVTNCTWAEGPVYLKSGLLVWSDVPGNRMWAWSEEKGEVSVFREPSNYSNGNTLDLQGRMVTCEHGKRRVTRTEHDGTVQVVVDSYQGKKFNSPNDVVVKSDGTLWFTDPPYGILPGTKEGYASDPDLDGCYVFRHDPATGETTLLIDDMIKPNGIAFSLDEQRLYVADTGASHDPNVERVIRVYDVVDGKSVTNGRTFCHIDPGMADGFRFDENGYLFTSSADSIQVYAEDGVRLGKILVPETISNCAFGGPEGNRLYITATTSLYAMNLNTRGFSH